MKIASLLLLLILAACNQKSVEAFKALEEASDEELVGAQLVDETEIASEEAQGENLDSSGTTAFEQVRALFRYNGKAVAECAGIAEDVETFRAKRQALKAEGKSKQEIKELLQEDHQTVKSTLQSKRAKIKECRLAQKDSEAGQALQAVIASCFDQDQKMKKRKRGHRQFGKMFSGKKHRRDKKGRKGMLRRPPLKSQTFSAPECQSALTGASAYTVSE